MELITSGKPEEIVNRYKSTVYGIGLSHAGNRFDADDIFRNVFTAYFSKSRLFFSEEHRKARLIKTTLNYCKKLYAENARNGYDLSENAPHTDFRFEDEEENLLYEAILSLPPKHRTATYLAYMVPNQSVTDSTVRKAGKEKAKSSALGWGGAVVGCLLAALIVTKPADFVS